MIARLFGGLLDRVVLLVGTVAGGCIPSFVVQYRQRVGGRLDQVLEDLAPFREIANRLHQGSLEALIQHHLQSSDATFHAEGQAIQSMVDAQLRLQATLQAMQGSVFDQLLYLIAHADPGIARATWDAYLPAFTLTIESMAIALLTGVSLWLVFLGLWHGTAALMRPRSPHRIRT